MLTHNEEIAKRADRVVYMKNGMIRNKKKQNII